MEGRWTYVGDNRNSVTDYILVNGESREMTMKIGSEEKKGSRLREIIRWRKEGREIKENLEPRKSGEGWKELKKRMQGAMIKKKVKMAGKRRENDLWDDDCKEKRREAQRAVEEVKKGKTERTGYIREKRAYNLIIIIINLNYMFLIVHLARDDR